MSQEKTKPVSEQSEVKHATMIPTRPKEAEMSKKDDVKSAPKSAVMPEEAQRLERERVHKEIVEKRDKGLVKRVGYLVNEAPRDEEPKPLSCHFCGDTYVFEPGDTKIADLKVPERTGASPVDLANHANNAIGNLKLVWRWE